MVAIGERRLVRSLVDDEHRLVLEQNARLRDGRAPEDADTLDLVGQRDHVERPERRRRVAEPPEVIEIARERVGIARHVGERRRCEAADPIAGSGAQTAPRRVDDGGVERLAPLDEAAERGRDVGADGADVERSRARCGIDVRDGGGERFDEDDRRASRREAEADGARAAVEIEHA